MDHYRKQRAQPLSCPPAVVAAILISLASPTPLRGQLAVIDVRAPCGVSNVLNRAAETAQVVRRAFGLDDGALSAHKSLYHAAPEDMLDTLHALPADTGNVALVGHNPGVTHFVNLLIGSHEITNLPTFGIAKFKGIQAWGELSFGAADLDLVVTPKSVKKSA